jgi:hypothetical protein
MEFVKLPKSDFPEIMQDEMQELLNTYFEATGVDICKEAQEGRRYLKNDTIHPINALMYSLFYEGNVYKVTDIKDLLLFTPAESRSVDSSPLDRFKNSITCPLDQLAAYYGSSFTPHPGISERVQLKDEAIIASWRLKLGI